MNLEIQVQEGNNLEIVGKSNDGMSQNLIKNLDKNVHLLNIEEYVWN